MTTPQTTAAQQQGTRYPRQPQQQNQSRSPNPFAVSRATSYSSLSPFARAFEPTTALAHLNASGCLPWHDLFNPVHPRQPPQSTLMLQPRHHSSDKLHKGKRWVQRSRYLLLRAFFKPIHPWHPPQSAPMFQPRPRSSDKLHTTKSRILDRSIRACSSILHLVTMVLMRLIYRG
jgi:hypothetical protein